MRRTSLALALAALAFPVLSQADCGWLLMMPPDVPSESRRESSRRPIIEWKQLSAYDSAAACQNAVAQLYGAKPENQEAMLFARCLPASQVPVK